MCLKANKRIKDGKVHFYWTLVESVRAGRRVFQRQALYLGELNDSQRAEWQRAIEAFDEKGRARQLKLFPADRAPADGGPDVVKVRMEKLSARILRNWGGGVAGAGAMEAEVALALAPDGFPLACEVLPGNTSLRQNKTVETGRSLPPPHGKLLLFGEHQERRFIPPPCHSFDDATNMGHAIMTRISSRATHTERLKGSDLLVNR